MRRRRRLGGLDERMNGKIESLPEHHGDSEDLSYLVFYSYPLTSFFFFFLLADFYFLAGILYISRYGRYNQVRILAAAFFINISLFYDRLDRPTARPVFPVEPRFVWFSQNSCISGSLSKKPNFNPIFGFSDRTVRFGPNFKTFVEMVSITLIIISICKFFVKNFLIVLAFF